MDKSSRRYSEIGFNQYKIFCQEFNAPESLQLQGPTGVQDIPFSSGGFHPYNIKCGIFNRFFWDSECFSDFVRRDNYLVECAYIQRNCTELRDNICLASSHSWNLDCRAFT